MAKYGYSDNKPYLVRKRGFRLACCDCGLVHVINFTVKKNRDLMVHFTRDNRATGQIRRHLKPKR